MKYRSVAIDGPSGAGKSTLAKSLAQKLGFLYVDTGAIYRTVGLAVRERGIAPSDVPAVTALLPELEIAMSYGEDGLQHMTLNGADVTEAIRQNEISDYASKVSPIPEVRAFLMEMQRKTAREYNVIMDGRDIGTVVLPQADLKIFLTAAPEARAERRCRELLERGQQADYDQVLREVMERDSRDSRRSAAPLRQAEDAVLVDTTGLDLDGSLRRLLELIQDRLGLGKGQYDE